MGEIVNRMSELRTMAADVTKNTIDIENYSKEFRELQSQLNQVRREKFNGISLFAVAGGVSSTGTLNSSTSASYSYVDSSGTEQTASYSSFANSLHPPLWCCCGW